MSEWFTYTLSDLLLFSPRVYYRLLELHNRELWPAPVLTFAAGGAMVVLWTRAWHQAHRIAFAVLGMTWIWVAWAFFWERYATINWAMAYAAPVFAAQGLLLIWFGAALQALVPVRHGRRALAGFALLCLAVLAYPLLAPTAGRAWAAAESFGMMPDPTAIATLAAVSLGGGRTRWVLAIVPALWCGISGATLWAMEAPDFFVPPLAAAIGAGVMVSARR